MSELRPRRRKLFIAAAMLIAIAGPCVVLLAVDVYLHSKYERSGGFNVWGYRGTRVGRKAPRELRVAVLGGSTAFGYGVDWQETIPALLERRLANRAVPGVDRISVVNLGYNNEGAYSFRFTLEDYRWLDYDIVCLYEGYNDMMGDPTNPNTSVYRRASPIYRFTGYLPIFPVIFREKAAILAHGDVNSIYMFGGKTVFRPSMAARAGAGVLNTTAAVTQAMERQLDRLSPDAPKRITDVASTGCKYPWQEYCKSVAVGTEYALQTGASVVVVTQPYEIGPVFRARHSQQQSEMSAMLERKFGGNRRVRYLNLGDAVDLVDPAMCFDGMHLTGAGNARIAEALVEPVAALAAERASGTPQH